MSGEIAATGIAANDSAVFEPELAPGEVVGGFRIQGLLGRTPWAATYAAYVDQTEVALKVMATKVVTDALVAALTATRESLLALPHDLVMVPVAEGKDDVADKYFVAEPLSTYPSLADLVDVCPLTLDELIVILRGIAKGLDPLHGRGIGHLAIKPTNVFVGPPPSHEVKVGDFSADMIRRAAGGVSIWLAPEQSVLAPVAPQVVGSGTVASTKPPPSRGTATTKPPGPGVDIGNRITLNPGVPMNLIAEAEELDEQELEEEKPEATTTAELEGPPEPKAAGPRADVFSSALLVFFGLTGRSFWAADPNDEDALLAEVRGPRMLPSQRARDVGVEIDPSLDEVLLKALSVVPEDRFANVRAFVDALVVGTDDVVAPTAAAAPRANTLRPASAPARAVTFSEPPSERHVKATRKLLRFELPKVLVDLRVEQAAKGTVRVGKFDLDEAEVLRAAEAARVRAAESRQVAAPPEGGGGPSATYPTPVLPPPTAVMMNAMQPHVAPMPETAMAMKETAARGFRRFELPPAKPATPPPRQGGIENPKLLLVILVGGGALLMIGIVLIIIVLMRMR